MRKLDSKKGRGGSNGVTIYRHQVFFIKNHLKVSLLCIIIFFSQP